ncbi:MAG: DUF1572 domain-containing protein [Chitinophagaceae bacterium]|nr:DUF1572 domain-containing protein [Chitinophagaceae bacterium]
MLTAAAFTTDIVARFKYYKALGDQTFAQLSESELKWTPHAEGNSIAIIVQHLYGNMMSRFTNFLTEDGEKPWRNRDAEFEPMDISKQDLIDFWETGWSHVFAAISSLTNDNLLTPVFIRGEQLSAYHAVLRQLAHYSYHVGQIVLLGKMIRQQDWHNLSIPKKGSDAFNAGMKAGHIKGGGAKR